MATIHPSTSGSPLIGNPIIYVVNAETYSNPVFHRVRLNVYAGMQGGNYTKIQMSSPVTQEIAGGEPIQIDVSSALRAIADTYEYTAEPPEYYPYISYYLEAYDEHMVNGEVIESTHDFFPDIAPGQTVPTQPLRALMGAYSDLERLLAGEQKQTLKFSRKPTTSPEIVRVGDLLVRPVDMVCHSGNITHGQQSRIYPITVDGLQTQGGKQVYALPADSKDYYQIRFINTLNAEESVTVRSLRTTEANISTQKHILSRFQTFGTFARGLTVKQDGPETWNMSTGPLDEAWQQWYIHEFLVAEYAWINLRTSDNPLWVTCHILPSDNVAGVNRKDATMQEVEFGIELDIAGSPLSELAV